MWVVREGYEGLVRGNAQAAEQEAELVNAATEVAVLNEAAIADDEVESQISSTGPDENLIHNLRFGDGELLKDGTSEFVGGRTLKGRYIVRVGWDDVRGWYSQVCDVEDASSVLTDDPREALSSVQHDQQASEPMKVALQLPTI